MYCKLIGKVLNTIDTYQTTYVGMFYVVMDIDAKSVTGHMKYGIHRIHGILSYIMSNITHKAERTRKRI